MAFYLPPHHDPWGEGGRDVEGRTGGCGNLQGGVSSCLAGWVGPGSLWSPRGLPPCLKERPESDPRVGFATPGCPRLAGEEMGQANPLARSRQEACGRARSPTNHGSSAAGLLCPSVTHRKGCRRPGGTKEERDEATWHHRGSGGGHWGGGGLGFLTPSLPQPPTLGQVSTLHLPHYYVAHPTGGEN